MWRVPVCWAVGAQVVDVPNPSKTALALQWSALKNGDAWVALITVRHATRAAATESRSS
jgi:hypothetical protein